MLTILFTSRPLLPDQTYCTVILFAAWWIDLISLFQAIATVLQPSEPLPQIHGNSKEGLIACRSEQAAFGSTEPYLPLLGELDPLCQTEVKRANSTMRLESAGTWTTRGKWSAGFGTPQSSAALPHFYFYQRVWATSVLCACVWTCNVQQGFT